MSSSGSRSARPGATATPPCGEALCRALARRGHRVVFFERDVDYYAMNRDLTELPGGRLRPLPGLGRGRHQRRRGISRDADVAMVTSYCPDGIAATDLVLASPAPVRAFYDLDTPVTLAALKRRRGGRLHRPARPARLRPGAELHGRPGAGRAAARLGARRVAPLYGSVDPAVHRPAAPLERLPRRPLLPRHLRGGPAGRRSRSCSSSRRGGCRRPRFLIGGALLPGRFSLDRQHLLRPAPPAARASGLLRSCAAHAERDAPRHGGDGLLPLGPAVRGRGLRRAAV